MSSEQAIIATKRSLEKGEALPLPKKFKEDSMGGRKTLKVELNEDALCIPSSTLSPKKVLFKDIATSIKKDSSHFYGHNIPSARWAKKLGQMRTSPTKVPYFCRFTTQLLAFNQVNLMNQRGGSIERWIVFAKEIGGNGKREFIVTTLHEFWNRYCRLHPSNRCHYEVIPHDHSCHLYFDLEYLKGFEENMTIDSSKLTSYFSQFLCYAMAKMLHVSCQNENILRLVATSERKFSQHWIVKIEDSLFVNNVECGKFVKAMLEHLQRNVPIADGMTSISILYNGKEKLVSFTELSALFTVRMDKEGKTGWFVDCAVYTRNRNFRLYGSQKKSGSSPILLVDKDSAYPLPYAKGNSEEINFSVFSHSLISSSTTMYKKQSKNLKIISLPQCIQRYEKEQEKKEKKGPVAVSYSTAPIPLVSSDNPFKKHHLKKLDEYVISWVKSRHPAIPVLRKRMFLSCSYQFRYSIFGNRFCSHIGREHKSNHIFVTVSLKEGFLVQQCLDPNCRLYSSPRSPIPSNILVPLLHSDSSKEDEYDEIFAQMIEENTIPGL